MSTPDPGTQPRIVSFILRFLASGGQLTVSLYLYSAALFSQSPLDLSPSTLLTSHLCSWYSLPPSTRYSVTACPTHSQKSHFPVPPLLGVLEPGTQFCSPVPVNNRSHPLPSPFPRSHAWYSAKCPPVLPDSGTQLQPCTLYSPSDLQPSTLLTPLPRPRAWYSAC